MAACLLVHKVGLPLFLESGHAFLLVLGSEQRVENLLLVPQSLLEGRLVRSVHSFLSKNCRGQSHRSDLFGNSQGLWQELAVWAHLGYETLKTHIN